MLVEDEAILKRLSIIRLSVTRLRRLKDEGEASFHDSDNFAVAEHHLRRALEALLDICRHVLAKEGLARPGDYRDSIILLGREGILPREFVKSIEDLAKYRNRLVHNYEEVIQEEMFQFLEERLDQLELFSKHIVDYYESSDKK